MRILLLADCYLPSTKSSAKLIHDLAMEYVRQGHEVVIACPDEPEQVGESTARSPQPAGRGRSWALNLFRKGGSHGVGLENPTYGLTVLRIPTGAIKGASRWLRGFNEARLSRTFWKAAGEWFTQNPCDLIVFYSPTIFFGGLVKRLKSLWNCPAYLVLRDIFPQWAVDAGILRKGPAWVFFRWAELRQYAAADVIGVQSPANLDYFREQHLAGHRLDVLYNWTALNEPEVPATNFREAWGLQDKLIYFYGGNIGVAQDMDNLLRLASSLREERRIHFLLVGDGSESQRVAEAIDRKQLPNVTLKASVGQGEYLGLLREVDVGLMSLDRHLKTQNFPGKMLGYMANRLPVLASVNPGNDLKDLFDRHRAGLVFWNGDDAGLRTAALSLAFDPSLRRQLGGNARRLLETTFSARQAASQILERAGVRFAIRRAA